MVRVGVLGAGGVGSALAAMLHRADPAAGAVLIGRPGPHLDRIARHGLRVRPAGGPEWVTHPDARPADAVPAGSLDVLVLLTKAFDGAAAVAGTAHLLAPGGVAVSLQNGLGNDAVLAAEFGGARALAGVTTIGAARQEPGEVAVAAGTAAGRSLTHVGPLGQACAPAECAARVAGVLSAAGLPCVAVTDAAAQVWGKLAMAVMSPVSAVLGLPVGAVWAQPDGRALVRAMFDEVVTVAAGDGVVLDRDAAWAHAAATFEHTGEHRTSMCDDVLAGRPTELDAMAGAVERRGRAHGLDLPAHTAVLRLLRIRIGAARPPAAVST
ncbi:ketopantoate reductase family protein [Pseudonocardia parietis]|uniref:2-dehydropantoate 2-reductase n=1 Tax=Pseudonocardia parietis TaxID=570936 RepID=A0ABS4VZP2_9PSEU|nr:2-dehydropantoate 2-reductase [Pseudonocardia parietis]MBP2369400.1 2-dehydropantoate 2-reductase [Pseudonocardia parietis]